MAPSPGSEPTYVHMYAYKSKKKEFRSGRELAQATKVLRTRRGSSALPTTLSGHC